ncbi:MAG: PPOX class F420-dependent oxidoreductase [Acidimicrobiales bacterium]|nr:PPOX class F420-dependent oxidoreductase [Acidimicrobiales bacterium]
MVALPESARELLRTAALGHVVTINPDGSPQVTCVWLGLDGDDVVFASLGPWKKLQNLARDQRVALSVEAPGRNPVGMQEYLVLHGTARITEGGAPELLQALAGTYAGPGVKFPPMDDPPPGSVVHISVERVGGMGPWVER